MIDVHVLLLPDTNAEWFQQCMESMENEDNITVHLTDGIEGDLGGARANGYVQGKGEYVSYVDPDDLIVPGVFAKCEAMLDADPSAAAIFTLSDAITDTGEPIKSINPLALYRAKNNASHYPAWTRAHQIIVYRREVIEKILPELREQNNLWADRWAIAFARRYGHFLCTEEVGYHWRRHDKQTHKTSLKETPTGVINGFMMTAIVEEGLINGVV